MCSVRIPPGLRANRDLDRREIPVAPKFPFADHPLGYAGVLSQRWASILDLVNERRRCSAQLMLRKPIQFALLDHLLVIQFRLFSCHIERIHLVCISGDLAIV